MPDVRLAERLLIKPGYKALFVNAPDGYSKLLGRMPAGVTILEQYEDSIDVIQVFVKSVAELETHLNSLKPLLQPLGTLWVSFPKATARITSDIDREVIEACASAQGLKPAGLISLDKTWSALRFKLI
jgi:predicted CoA-binding protein